MKEPHEHEMDGDHLPPPSTDADVELRSALLARFGGQPLVPPATDEAVLERARAHFALIRQERARRRWRLGGAGVAAAALLAASVWVVGPWASGPAAPPAQVQRPALLPDRLAGDVNGDGMVDVLDMLVLARHLEAGIEPPAHADVTGDRAVTLDDIHMLGRRIVALPPADEEPRS